VNSWMLTSTSPLTEFALTELARRRSSFTSPLTVFARTSPVAPVIVMLPLTEFADTCKLAGTETSRSIRTSFQSWFGQPTNGYGNPGFPGGSPFFGGNRDPNPGYRQGPPGYIQNRNAPVDRQGF